MDERQAQLDRIKSSGGWLVAFGIALVLFGLISASLPFVTTAALALFMGVALMVGGGVQIIHAFRAHSWGAGLWTILAGALALACGFLFVKVPDAAIGFLALVVAVYFLIQGITVSLIAIQLNPAEGWGWTLASGILMALLGVMLLSGWPIAGMMAIGLYVGLHFLFRGWAMIALGMAARGAAKEALG